MRLGLFAKDARICGEVLARFGRWVPWEREVLKARVACLSLDNHAGLASAREDLAEFMADADFVSVPVKGLLDPAYLTGRAQSISLGTTLATPVAAGNPPWRDGALLAAEVDFIGVHTYPVWENKSIDEALAYTIENIEGVRAALPGKPIVILEAGWATAATEFGERANEADQSRYFQDMRAWAGAANTTVFFFEAFDEPWKGSEVDLLGAEKHWGLFNVDRTPKQVASEILAGNNE